MPRVDGQYLARKHRDIHLPEILIDKGVPKTNQSIVYKTGDDGYYQAGIAFSTPRFWDNGDGTVTDQATKLMWVADPSILGTIWGDPGNPLRMTLQAGIINCNNLEYAGYTDWRMPNVKELESLVDYSRATPSIDADKFPNTQADIYYSSTITEFSGYRVFVVDFSSGETPWEPDPSIPRLVRPVRLAPTGHKITTGKAK